MGSVVVEVATGLGGCSLRFREDSRSFSFFFLRFSSSSFSSSSFFFFFSSSHSLSPFLGDDFFLIYSVGTKSRIETEAER